MAYAIKIVNTKPPTAVWFGKSSPSAAIIVKNMGKWTSAQPGYKTSMAVDKGANVNESIMIWDTKENCDAWISAKVTQPDFVAHEQYFAANGIKSVITII